MKKLTAILALVFMTPFTGCIKSSDDVQKAVEEFFGSLFVEGCQRPPPEGPGLNQRQAATLWDQVLAFAGYGFNQGHATSYAVVSYRSAYLKTHWPAAFLCARLAEWGGFHHPAIYMAEATRLGLDVRPPHVNHSHARFALGWEGERGILWMGLGRVRDLRRGMCFWGHHHESLHGRTDPQAGGRAP